MNSVTRKKSQFTRQSAIIQLGSGGKFRLQRVSRIENPVVFLSKSWPRLVVILYDSIEMEYRNSGSLDDSFQANIHITHHILIVTSTIMTTG